MKLPFRDAGEGGIRGPALEAALEELCDRKAFVLLATPYLALPAHLVGRRGEELRLRAAISEGALRAFGSEHYRLRIPWGLGMVTGQTRILGFEQEEGRRVLRLAVPHHLAEDERRAALRLRLSGDCRATLSPDGIQILQGSIEDLSVQGMRIFVPEVVDEAFGRSALRLSLALDKGFELSTGGRWVHQDGLSHGIRFSPPLDPGTRETLERWMLPGLEAARERWENRAALRAEAAARVRKKLPPEGALFVGSDPELAAQLAGALGDLLPLRACAAGLASLRGAMDPPSRIVLFHWPGGGVQASHLLGKLMDAVPDPTPVLLVGSGREAPAGRQLAAARKLSFLDWNPSQAPFFRRLALGLLRRAWGDEPGA